MIFRLAFVASLFFAGTLAVQAQESDETILQNIREKAMQTMQKGYETYATCRNAAYTKEFTRLFVNDEAKVYNDLLGLSAESTLTVEKYAQILGGSGVKNTIVTISGITFQDEPYKENGKWKVDVAFNKRMSYFDDCGIYYNSYDFYHADYNLTATLQYDVVDSECRIESIKGSVDSYEELPEQYFVFKQTDERDRNLFYKRNPLRFNSGNQAVVEGEFDPMAFSHANPKVRRLYPEIDECNIATMGYGITKTSTFLLRPHFDLGLGGLSIDGGNSEISTSSSSFGFGVDFGLPLVESGSIKLNAFAGIGVNMSTIDLGYVKPSCSIDSVKDLDGDYYTRKYENVTISQKVKLTELAVPLYLDAELDLSSGFSLYGDVGVRFNFNMSKSVELNSLEVNKIYGKYGQKYGEIELDHTWGYEDFYDKNERRSLKYTMKDILSGVSGMTFDIIGGAGLRYNIPNTPLTIDLGLKFQLGLSEMVKPENKQQKIPPITYPNYDESDKERMEQVSSLTNMLTSVKRNALALNIGLIFKF